MFKVNWFLVASVVAIFSAQHSAMADTTISGSLAAASPCDLQPLQETEAKACMQMILPIQGRLTITSTKGRRVTVPVSRSGRFSAKLRTGTYTFKLIKALIHGSPAAVPAGDLHLTKATITVANRPLMLNIGVIHKSYLVLIQ